MSLSSQFDLPEPDPEVLRISQKLGAKIRRRIDSEGSLSFADFMQMALYEPGLGYYSAGLKKFGRDGDFITAPETSALFGQCLARQITEIFSTQAHSKLLEFGAGSGRLACDLLKTLEQLHALPEEYLIMEISADLRHRQQALIEKEIPQLAGRVTWLDALPTTSFTGVVIANEVLDAMPVERFRISHKTIEQMRVIYDSAGFKSEFVPAKPALLEQIDHLQNDLNQPFSEGYSSEINGLIKPWLATIEKRLSSGVIFCVDYGESRRDYYHPDRGDGTFICHYRHRVHEDPFFLVGGQDMTASVDFTAVAEAGLDTGLELIGYTTQAQFLLACGMMEILAENQVQNPSTYLQLSSEAKKLILPGEMGERFKVMALGKAQNSGLRGFSMADYRERL